MSVLLYKCIHQHVRTNIVNPSVERRKMDRKMDKKLHPYLRSYWHFMSCRRGRVRFLLKHNPWSVNLAPVAEYISRNIWRARVGLCGVGERQKVGWCTLISFMPTSHSQCLLGRGPSIDKTSSRDCSAYKQTFWI